MTQKYAAIRSSVCRGAWGCLTLTALGFGALGCSAAVEPDEAADPAEKLQDIAPAIADQCATVPRDDVADIGYESAPCPRGLSAPSQNGDYGQSGCENKYVVGYGSYFGGTLHGRVLWSDPLPATSASCLASRMALAAYTYDGTSWSHQQTTLIGQWQPILGCHFVYQSPQVPLDSIPPGLRHRLVASAYQISLSGTVYHRVQTRLYDNSICIA